ncbi:MAG: uracil-DNA glycosylase, partial [Acidimicrobiia bacterium]|nr:uracil-DNA glycosylase [Acidimicrobiia bacterium]
NKPTIDERDACAAWLDRELAILAPSVLVALGDFAYRSIWRYLADTEHDVPRPRLPFAHGLEIGVLDGPVILASFHPSQQNTFTGRLTEEMLDLVFRRARELVDQRRGSG